jgi:dienelactone hydrolase
MTSHHLLFPLLACMVSLACAAERLPQTSELDWPEEDLSRRMMIGAHRFVERKISEAASQRAQFWKYDASSAGAWNAAVKGNRARLQEIIGAAGVRPTPQMERFGDDAAPALVAETSVYQVLQVRWPAGESVISEGLLVQPKQRPAGCVVVVPDANQTPEQLLGLAPGLPPDRQWARRLAETGILLVIPTLVTRQVMESHDPILNATTQTEREWIYRQAYHMGRHVIGYEVQKVRAAVDWIEQQHRVAEIGVAGYGEGGLIAFYAAAVDVRIDAVLVSGYFDAREQVWSEPIFRNVWSLLKTFGDAEIASLILPRQLVVEHAEVPNFRDSKGESKTPTGASVRKEFERIPQPAGFRRPILIAGPDAATTGPGSEQALQEFVNGLDLGKLAPSTADSPTDQRKNYTAHGRRRRVLSNLEQSVQQLVNKSDTVRDQAFLYQVMPELAVRKWTTEPTLPTHGATKFMAGAAAYRQRFLTDGMGKFDESPVPLNPRSRFFREGEKWIAYDVVLEVWPEVFAWGVLVLPKDIKAGEQRPVVVCQHGRDGLPSKTMDAGVSGYGQVAVKLAEEGFITFAPHNLYRGEDEYRWLSRKSNNVQATLFSFIIAQHNAILRWLGTLPQVDAKRIGFYGLSYGGETAVRAPTILQGYALSICSGDFNQWTRKVAATDYPNGFMRSIEWEMPYWNLGHTFDYAEMAYLMIPRPFMVERGHLDLVGTDSWVAHEYSKVRWLYSQLGLADRTTIQFFQGGHSMKQEESFRFLREHLQRK